MGEEGIVKAGEKVLGIAKHDYFIIYCINNCFIKIDNISMKFTTWDKLYGKKIIEKIQKND